MRKNFIILLFTLFSILPNFSHANQNPDVINQQRNVEFMNMMGQIEFDKRRAQETYKKMYGEKPNRYIDWDCGMAAITMGVSKKTGKIEAYVDTDIKAWIKKYGENDPDIFDKVNQDALDYCSTQADNCQLMYGTYDIPDNR